MAVIVIVITLMRPGIRWHEGDVTMPDATFSDDAIRERLHLRAFALQHRHFEATIVVEMDMEGRLRDAMMVMKFLGAVSPRSPGHEGTADQMWFRR